jgi:CRISPR-associated protein Csm5
MNVTNKFYIKTTSPIHIGSDEVYEPTGFILDENEQKMVSFDPLFFISKMEGSEKEKFSQICAKGTIASILEIYQFMRHRHIDGRVIDVCNDFLDHYRQTLSLPLNNDKELQKNLNKFIIPRTAFCPVDQRPYIPGSSIKGSLRTAYLNLMENEKNLSKKGKIFQANNLEQQLMDYSGITDDPFRMVKVSDFMPAGDIKTKIIYAVNEKKKHTDQNAQGLPLIFEVVLPGSVFVGSITVTSPLPGANLASHLSIERLLNSSALFYKQEKERENKELKEIGISTNSDHANEQDKNSPFLMRLGRHSGAESVTVSGHRKIKIMMGKKEKKELDHATTLWLASETRRPADKTALQPFGWVRLGKLTEQLLEEFEKKEGTWDEKRQKNIELQKAEEMRREENKRRIDEEKERLAIEAERIRKDEEERKKQLEAMPPEEKAIAELNDPRVLEDRVVEIYKEIDTFSEENKKQLALALKKYWETNGKWEKKSCSKKQWEKVKKVKSILGE